MIVNLELGERFDKRTGLASLRAKRTGPVKKGLRGNEYTTSLAQSEAMWGAAATTTTLASPILRYYALLQAGRAVAASSSLRNNEWQTVGGHGLKLIVPDGLPPTTTSLAKVIVETHLDGAAQKLAQALGSPLLTDPAPLLDLIAALPRQPLLTERQDLPRRPLRIQPNSEEFPNGGPTFRWSAAPPGLSAPLGSKGVALPLDAVKEVFRFYPSLGNLTKIRSATCTNHEGYIPWIDVVLEPDLTEPTGSYWNPMFLPLEFWNTCLDVGRSSGMGGDDSGLVLPSVGGNDRPQHPLVTWHLVLYAFSMLARYHSPFWSSLLDYDKNLDAVPMRLLVDEDSQEALKLVELAILGFLADEAAEGTSGQDLLASDDLGE